MSEPAWDAGAALRVLRENAGLSWEQLGRMFGRSGRAVHMWANGAPMRAFEDDMLNNAVGVVARLGRVAGSQERLNTALYAPVDDTGERAVDWLMQQAWPRALVVGLDSLAGDRPKMLTPGRDGLHRSGRTR